jgi:hypothetical protein
MGCLSVFEDIAHTSHGSDEGNQPRTVHFTAEAVDMDIHHVCVRLDAHAPDLVENHRACDDAAGIAAQILKKHELLLSKLEDLASTRSLAAEQVEFEVLHANASCLTGWGTVALEQIAKAREQLSEGEGLGQIIVAALLKASDPIVNGAPGREDENRRSHTQLTQAEDESDSILIGQSEVDDEDVEGAFDSQVFGGFAIICGLDFVSCFFERTPKEGLNVDFIFH